MRGLRTALGLLTVIPVRPRDEYDDDPSWLASAPLVGLGLGLLAATLLAALRGLSADRYQQLLASALVIGFLAMVTRGLHLDGLADTADGLGAASSGRETGLAAMRDPHTGAFGVTAIGMVLLVDTFALWQDVVLERGTVSIVTAVTVGRCALLWGARRGVPSARSEGLGAGVVGSVPPSVAALASAALVVLCSAAGAIDDNRGYHEAAHVAIAAVVGLAAAIAVRVQAVRRLGGVTGDVLGAMVEVATAAVLVVMAYDINVS
ncbi:MAG: adenosylcobinamide-GDP ribazoletransferase [Frankiales bacterium]|nr:adenosylcobinamide-GDP ribazoletransferase [Frankiales bacterium]